MRRRGERARLRGPPPNAPTASQRSFSSRPPFDVRDRGPATAAAHPRRAPAAQRAKEAAARRRISSFSPRPGVCRLGRGARRDSGPVWPERASRGPGRRSTPNIRPRPPESRSGQALQRRVASLGRCVPQAAGTGLSSWAAWPRRSRRGSVSRRSRRSGGMRPAASHLRLFVPPPPQLAAAIVSCPPAAAGMPAPPAAQSRGTGGSPASRWRRVCSPLGCRSHRFGYPPGGTRGPGVWWRRRRSGGRRKTRAGEKSTAGGSAARATGVEVEASGRSHPSLGVPPWPSRACPQRHPSPRIPPHFTCHAPSAANLPPDHSPLVAFLLVHLCLSLVPSPPVAARLRSERFAPA